MLKTTKGIKTRATRRRTEMARRKQVTIRRRKKKTRNRRHQKAVAAEISAKTPLQMPPAAGPQPPTKWAIVPQQ